MDEDKDAPKDLLLLLEPLVGKPVREYLPNGEEVLVE
jgi:hypothetical protein